MRRGSVAFLIFLFAVLLQARPASATLSGHGGFTSSDAVMRWIMGYRLKPEPGKLPAAVRAMSQFGAFKDTESSGVYVGFIAGVLGANPARAEALFGKMLSIPETDQWAIVRSLAYSGLPEWKGVLRKFADRMPARKVMIEKYLDGRLPALDGIPLEKKNPTLWDKMTGKPSNPSEATFDHNPELLDTLWGIYFATGSEKPITRIVAMLPWSKDRDSADRLTVGSMAKFTLVNNAARDTGLLAMLKRASAQQPKETAPILKEVIDAAETMDGTRVRKEALASIEDLKRKGPGSKRDVSFWGQVGQGALALGCIVAATTGHIEFGLPCVVGGVASSAALSFWNNQQ
jgi:hypothetical protein